MATKTYGMTTEEKFERMQQIMFVVYPSLSPFYCMCNKKVVGNDVTLRLNTREGSAPCIEYSEEFVSTMSVECLTVLVSVELFRLLLHHCTTRSQGDYGLTMMASNFICCDPKIMNFLLPSELRDKFPKVSQLQELDPQFDAVEDLYIEKVYALLSRQAEQQQRQPEGQAGSSDDDGDSEDQGGSSNDDGDSEGQDGSEGPSGTSSGKDKSDEEKERDAIGKHFSPKQSRKNTEAWGENEIIDAQVSDEVNKKQISSWSDVGVGMQKRILKANELKFDPRSVLRRFATTVFSDAITMTRMRPNRRLPQHTGIIPGKRHAMKARVLFAIDCSGSMPESEIERACSVVNSSLKHAEVNYCFWDCGCSDFTEKRSTMSDFSGLGGGGTNPQCVIDKIEETKERFDGIVFITDCYFNWEEPKGKYKIFILHTKDAGEPPEWCKWHLGMDDIEKIAGN